MRGLNFVAIDVETANANMASICQIGVATYESGVLCDEWVVYVDPGSYFDPLFTQVHGIDEETVAGAADFAGVVDQLNALLDGRAVVSHTHYDRVAVRRACELHGVAEPDCRWLDSAKIVRRTWEQFARKGYGLANVCEFLGYSFDHHDALEDAKAAGHIVLAASKLAGMAIDDWLVKVGLPISNIALPSIAQNGNPNGGLCGEVVVFTGALSMSRREAAAIAAGAGCEVVAGVSKKITLLVVGDQDVSKLAGKDKSAKHLRAEALIAKGVPIRVLGESDFKVLVSAVGE